MVHLGYAGGYNEAVSHINEDLIFFLNNDAVFLDQKSFLDIIRVFEKNNAVLSIIIIKRNTSMRGHLVDLLIFLAIHFAVEGL